MRIFVLLFVLFMSRLHAQDIVGEWHGALDISGIKLRLVLHIDKGDEGFTATMDSPDQGAKGIPVSSVTFVDGALKLEVSAIGARYEGKLGADEIIEGIFFQGGQQFPLRLARNNAEAGAVDRPQEPKPPFPYHVEEVGFSNDDAGITLAGTLTLPEGDGPFPAVILITGSGPQNRDEELFGHKPFLVIADYLTRHGMAVLRYDDRGVGESTGNFASSTSADFASDAAAAFTFLKAKAGIDLNRIGLLGHSEGGRVAPMVASGQESVAFLVLLAAPGISIDSLMMVQSRMIGAASGLSVDQLDDAAKVNRQVYDVVIAEEDGWEQKLHELLSPVFDAQVTIGAMTREQASAAVIQQQVQLTSPWMRYFLKFEPAAYLSRVTCPVLALNGGNDLQVASNENLAGITATLLSSGNSRVVAKELPGLNHLFQESNTGLPLEYGTISQTISPIALDEILHWMKDNKIL